MSWMKKPLSLFVAAFCGASVLAQSPQAPRTPEQEEKDFYNNIMEEVDRLSSTLALEDWQTFYVDSILTADYMGMRAAMKRLQDSKVSNTDIYIATQDEWTEKIYQAVCGVLNEEQLKKYLKSGAERDKRARDKRKAKKSSVEL